MPDHGEFHNNALSSTSHSSPHTLEEDIWRLKVDDNNKEGVDANQDKFPDRPGAPDCMFYLRTGLCGYGSNCRYNHPTYNVQGAQDRGEFPERAGQPECQYFLKTGTCKYGSSCKYHHPRDRYDAQPTPLNILGFPIRQIPNTKSPAQSTPNLPERPDQPECQYYLKTGSCRYGPTCKYHHPKETYSDSPLTLGPLGLPLRPGRDICTYYITYGSCRYGAACKYDHPLMGFYNYSVPPLSVPDPSTIYPPSPMCLPQATSPSPATRTPTIKTAKSPDRLKKSGPTNITEAYAYSDNSNDHIDETQAMSPSATTARSSDSPQRHSD